MALSLNQQAPNFTLPSTTGEMFTLYEDAKAKSSILFFYPKDFTRGCTQEACRFRDAYSFFRNLKIDIWGISRDSIISHLKFKEKHNLPFELLSDKEGEVCKMYDAIIPILRFPKRVTYLLDNNFFIKGVYQDIFHAHRHIEYMVDILNTN